ncbi:MAG: glycosyltransferase family 2 protein [Bacteroidales bacterium]|nr:glycosyltransferase family 2 protein [Bacteroidales bacterium]
MKVAVVILNWNGKDFLQRFLPSVYYSVSDSDFSVDVVVADNGSTDESLKAFNTVKESLTNAEGVTLKWLQLEKNWGFAKGYNLAFKRLKEEGDNSDLYVLLNSDIDTPDGWLTPLVNFMQANPAASICQPKILSYSHHEKVLRGEEKQDLFEYAGAAGGFIDRFGFPFCRGRILSHLEEDNGQYDTPIRCFWASGACMVVRSSVYNKLGGLDDNFFAHMEEIDFCWRSALMGGEIWCVPSSKVYHVGGGTLPNNSPRKLYLNYRNNLLMLYKNLPEKGKGSKIFLRKCLDGLSAVCYFFQGNFKLVSAVFKAHRDYKKMKREALVSPRSSSYVTERVYGTAPFSIVRKFFSGKKKFSSLSF